jgi:acyl-CoA synthetase (AMP-forming)/AMP-acid ligase II
MIFKCSPNIKIFSTHWFNYNDLSVSVGYWANFLKEKYGASDTPIGIVQSGELSFSTMSFLLALYETKINYVLMPYYDYTVPNYCEKYILPNIQELIILGNNSNNKIKALTRTVQTSDFHHTFRMFENPRYSPLEFEFNDTQKITTFTSGSTGPPRINVITADQEGRAILAAINEYFDKDDVCLFSHGLTHRGVHTTAILPALFSANTIMTGDPAEWEFLIKDATHCQWFATMKTWCSLTPNIKKVTFGGSILSDSTADYIFSCCPDATIYDIYGLTESLPPVAIRKLTKDNRTDVFRSCRPDLNIVVTSGNNLNIIDIQTDKKIKTGDVAERISDTEFKFLGRDKKAVRVNGELVNQSVMISRIGNEFDALSFSVSIKNETLVIQVTNESDQEKLTNWCTKNLVEDFTVELVDNITTSGGIKTINH